MRILFPDSLEVAWPDRTFHIEAIVGGASKLLLRSYGRLPAEQRLELCFTNVRHISIGSVLVGPRIRLLGRAVELPKANWCGVDACGDDSVFEVITRDGTGLIVAEGAHIDSANLTREPSVFLRHQSLDHLTGEFIF